MKKKESPATLWVAVAGADSNSKTVGSVVYVLAENENFVSFGNPDFYEEKLKIFLLIFIGDFGFNQK